MGCFEGWACMSQRLPPLRGDGVGPEVWAEPQCVIECFDVQHRGLIFFFFQAEDGIRDDLVTGVQTCALPISRRGAGAEIPTGRASARPEPRSRSARRGA